MSMSCDRLCPHAEVVRKHDDQWCASQLSPEQFREETFQTNSVVFIFAQGDKVRGCNACRAHFERTFQMPKQWWYTWCRRANGYFGSEERVDRDGKIEAHNTWFRFIVKRFLPKGVLEGKRDYVWYKFNIFTHWIAQTQTTYVLVFDPRPEVKAMIVGTLRVSDNIIGHEYSLQADTGTDTNRSLLGHNKEENEPENSAQCKGLRPARLLDRITELSLTNPYAIHVLFMEDVVYQQEESVWGIRDRLREVELQRTSKEHPNPDYEKIHDVARHAIHVSETLDAAISTIVSIKAEHAQFQIAQEPADKTKLDPADRRRKMGDNRIRRALDFSDSMLRNLRCRSSSNRTRLQNEIQLSFNVVSQQIGRSAKADSNAMLSIALLTMIFIPPTFMSGIFSMTFFDFDQSTDRWVISNKFWLYLAFTIPLTLTSICLFVAFYLLNKPAQAGTLQAPLGEMKKAKLKQFLLEWKHRDDAKQSSPA